MKIEIDKEDFVRLATYAACADLPEEEENKYEMTLRKTIDSLDEDVAAGVAFDILVLGARIEMLRRGKC